MSMIEELAQVQKLNGDKAIIEIHRQNACQSCELSGGCGTGSLGRLLGYRKQSLIIQNDYNLKIGDRVVVGLPDKSYLSAGLVFWSIHCMGASD